MKRAIILLLGILLVFFFASHGWGIEGVETVGQISQLIEQIKSSDWQIRYAAAEKLIQAGSPAVPGLIEALKGASVAVRGKVIFTLGRIGDPRAIPTLIEAAKDENTYVRQNAIEALGMMKDNRCLSALIQALSDYARSVRQRAALSLGNLGNLEAVKSLTALLPNEKDEGVKITIVQSLARLKDKTATVVLLAQLDAGYDLIYKNEVVFALGEIRDAKALPGLVKHLNELKAMGLPEDPMIRHQLEEAIRIAEEAIEKIKGGVENVEEIDKT